jgi:cytoskeleton protein RodZ
MEDEMVPQQAELGLRSVADDLRDAREAASLSIEDVADKTRIPLRHLLAIEQSRYDALPGKTYAIGFTKSYARAVGLSEPEIAARLRIELGDHSGHSSSVDEYEPASSARLPSRTLAITAAIIAAILMISYAVWRSNVLGESASETPIADTGPEETGADRADAGSADGAKLAPSAQGAGTAVASDAPVVITASSEVWMGFNDPAANGRLVFERTFKAGEAYTVPAEARGWTMRTSRAQAITITVAGKAVPSFGKPDVLVKDVPLDPVALAKMPVAAAVPSAGTLAPAQVAPN